MASRHRFVIGKLGSYECATVSAIDQHVGRLAAQLQAGDAAQWRRIWHDVDLLLDKRSTLTKAMTA